jgi:hypothetical protein
MNCEASLGAGLDGGGTGVTGAGCGCAGAGAGWDSLAGAETGCTTGCDAVVVSVGLARWGAGPGDFSM